MKRKIAVLGYGAAGKASAAALIEQGHDVVIGRRSEPKDLAAGASFHRVDVLDAGAVRAATAGASHVVLAVSFPYVAKLWADVWPRTITNVVEACAVNAARLVFVDNLYMYGPQSRPLSEDMPLTAHGIKPAVRSEVTRIWKAASDAGRIKAVALRAPDFYGPNVTQAQLGYAAFGALGQGKPATLIIPPDIPHAFAYVPDVARAVTTIIEAPDDAYGQVWHIPCAPMSTPRQMLEIGARAIGQTLKIRFLPMWTMPVAGLFMPIIRESIEMRFTFDRPYDVDARKFGARFWSDPTPIAVGAAEAARSFVPKPY